MFANILARLKWFYSFGTKFLRVAPVATSVIVILTIVSQIALLLAFFLPLKVILLLGSPEIPHYFPDSFKSLDRTALILLLSTSAAGFYLLYMLSEKFISVFTSRGAGKLLEKTRKISLFENQQEVAAKGYQRYARCLAGLFFIGLVFTVMSFIYPGMLLLVAGYSVASCFVLGLLYSFNTAIRAKIQQNYSGIVNALAAIGFLLSFGFIVFQFITGMTISILVAVIALLLSRQIYNRIASFVSDLGVLYAQRIKLNALFFHGQVLLKNDDVYKDDSFWGLFTPTLKDKWIKQAVDDLLGIGYTSLSAQWFQSGVPDVIAYTISIDNDKTSRYLLKLFNRNRESAGSHEATLLTEVASLPSLPLVALGHVNGLRCHIYALSEMKKISVRHVKSKSWEVMINMASASLPADLIARYERSKPYIWQRINAHMIDRLALAVTDELTFDLVDSFGKRLAEIQAQLQSSPLTVVNPDLNVDTLLVAEDDSVAVAHWGRWCIEPLGFGWPTQEKALNLIIQAVLKDTNFIRTVSLRSLKLAALMSAFERFYSKQQYQSAIDLLPEILFCLSSSNLNDA